MEKIFARFSEKHRRPMYAAASWVIYNFEISTSSPWLMKSMVLKGILWGGAIHGGEIGYEIIVN